MEEQRGSLWTVENGTIEQGAGGVLRWHINTGETSRLELDTRSKLFSQLYDYDLLQCEWRVATGEINELSLSTLGRVTGPRRGRVHQWGLGINTTPRQEWRQAVLDLSRPSWLPWNNPDGEGSNAFFRLEGMSLAPDTVIEFRNLRLSRASLVLKPDWEMPVTWPWKKENADGSVTYTLNYEVLNNSNRRANIEAKIISTHSRFKVALTAPKVENVAHGGRANFELTATISAEDTRATAELYAEPLRVAFGFADSAETVWPWNGVLVRPLTRGLARQLILAPADLELLRTKLTAGEAYAKAVTNFDRITRGADEFTTVRLDTLPGSYAHPATRFPQVPEVAGKARPWQMGSFMPEIVDKETGRREVGTPTANAWWKFYLSNGNGAVNLGTAYLLTGDEKYARQAVNLLELYGRQYANLTLRDTLGDVPWSAGPNTLASSRTSSMSSYGGNWNFKWIYKMLASIGESQAWQKADQGAIFRGFVLPYATETMKFPGGISNISDIASHNQLIAGLIFDDAHLVHWATMRDAGLLKRLSDIDSDGFSSEGRPVTYHLAAMDEYLPALVYLANSRLQLPGFEKGKILRAFKMPYERATLSGRVPITGDMGRGFTLRANSNADYLLGLFPEEKWLLDVGTGSTLTAQVHRLAQREPQMPAKTPAQTNAALQNLLSTQPRLYRDAGFAILRNGTTPSTQIMATLDWGRSVMHSGFDRNQFTLSAFGKTFTHGPGSTYNLGSGGIVRNTNPQLTAFTGYSTLAHNLVTVDGKDQLRAVGKLLKWSDKPEQQLAVSRVDGIAPGVSHTRGLMLTQGVIILLDRMESREEHTYDWTYHNFGILSLGTGWSALPHAEPLGQSNVYRNIGNLARLQNPGNGALLQASWDLTQQIPAAGKETATPVFLNFWHGGNGGDYFSGITGLNNPNTTIMPDAAPSVFHRVRGTTADFWTVLEPTTGASRVKSVTNLGGELQIQLQDGALVNASLDQWLLARDED